MHSRRLAAIVVPSLLLASHAIASLPTLMDFDVDRDGYAARAGFIAMLRCRFDAVTTTTVGECPSRELRVSPSNR